MSVASCIDTTADASEAGAGATTAAAAPSVGGAEGAGAAVGAAVHEVAPAARDTVVPGQMAHEVDAGAAEYMPIGLFQTREATRRRKG